MKNDLLKVLFGLGFLFSINTQADELRIYVITPRVAIDWSSPASLSVTSAIDSTIPDYAPIGHFAVEVNCSVPNQYGVKHVITGMERANKAESREITLEKGLGLGSLFYSFKGGLVGARKSIEEIAHAIVDHRLKVLVVPTSSSRCQSMLAFLGEWIDSGSDQVYGGGKKTAAGEGAGCADFANEFFRLATGEYFPYAWSVHLKIPNQLIGNEDRSVPFLDLLFRLDWARADEAFTRFSIPDTNLTSDWLSRFGTKKGHYYWWTKHLKPHASVESLPPVELIPFEFRYPVNRESRKVWEGIRLSR